MQNSDRRHTPFPPPGKKRRSPHTIRNVLIAAAVFLTAALIFSFGINKWQIHFMLNGEKEVTSECGTPYRDEGADAEVTGSILRFIHHPVNVEISTEHVNIHEPGTYTVTYTAKFMWITANDTRTVHIVDTTPPVIELKHIDDYYTLPHHSYEEEGFTATDNHDGDISDRVESEERDGVVYYSVTDDAGNKATAEREIFYDDRNAPVFHFPSGEEVFIYKGETWKNDVTADDDADGDVTKNIKMTGKVDTNKIGTYTVTYTVSDEWGNEARYNRYVTVKRKPAAAKGSTRWCSS